MNKVSLWFVFSHFCAEFNFEDYMFLIVKMKKEVLHLLQAWSAWPHIARMMLQKLSDLGYMTWPHSLYSSDLSPTANDFFKQ